MQVSCLKSHLDDTLSGTSGDMPDISTHYHNYYIAKISRDISLSLVYTILSCELKIQLSVREISPDQTLVTQNFFLKNNGGDVERVNYVVTLKTN